MNEKKTPETAVNVPRRTVADMTPEELKITITAALVEGFKKAGFRVERKGI